MADKIYFPEVIENQSLLNAEEDYNTPKSSALIGVSVQEGSSGVPFPISPTAREIISTSLNTQSKKILGNYTFGAQGALAIGTYESGVSGDVRISPDGLVGRDSTGATTFSIDGTTGDATFAGNLSAATGTLGAITIGSNAWHVDSSGNMWWGNFASYALASIKISSAGSVDFTTGNFSGTLSAAGGTLGTITSGTITGATFQTAASGARVQLTAADQEIAIYDAGNDKALSIDDTSGDIYYVVADGRSAIYDVPTGESHVFRVNNGNEVSVTSAGLNLLGGDLNCNTSYGINDAANLSMQGAIDMNGNDINEMDVISFNTRSSAPSDNWAIYAYSSGGTYELRVRVNGSNYRMDLTSV